MNITVSIIGRRLACTRELARINRMEEIGVIRNVKITKVGWITWHLYFEAESKSL